MRMSKLVGRREKQSPADAVIESHALMLRGGYIRQVVSGVYSLLPPAQRITSKIEAIIRQELDAISAQEVLMPVVLPRELWEESGRWEAVGPELVRFKDRSGHDMLLAMTHEEGVVHLVRNEMTSYKQYPFCVYQIQTKFRDEPRSRGGLIRVREFTMKDAYSFHRTLECLQQYYEVCKLAYFRIFRRLGLDGVVAIESDTGMMGGTRAHEFMVETPVGEDTIVACSHCDYRANLEVARSVVEPVVADMLPLEKVHTPQQKTIEAVADFLGVEEKNTAKAVFYQRDCEGKLVLAIVRGDLEVNETKLALIIGVVPEKARDETIVSAGAVPGFASPIGLSRDCCRVVVDHSAASSNNLVCGANEVDYHLKNFNLSRDAAGLEVEDISQVRAGDACSQCGPGVLELRRGVEVGNIFELGVKYSKAMGMSYLDEQGSEQVPLMGCYGIGVGRAMACVAQLHHDKYGPKWPRSITPWHVHVCVLHYNKDEVRQQAEDLVSKLEQAGFDVLLDDRNERPGSQFADADLLGIPLRLISSPRNLAADQVEWKRRDTGESGTVALSEVLALVSDTYRHGGGEDEQRTYTDRGC